MKILQVISGKTVNGAMTYCKFVTEQLTSLGHEVTILGRPDGWIRDNVDPSIQFVPSELARSPSEISRVARWVKANQIDVVHTHMSRGHAFGVLLRWMTGVPVVATAHNQSFQLHWRMNDYVIANSQATYDYQRRVNRVANRQMETVHCFTDLERFKHVKPLDVTIVRRQLRLKGDEFLVGVVGEVVARKGHLYLFEALSRVVKEVPNLKLVLLGRFNRNEAYVKKLRAIQLRDKIFCHVKWLGLRWNIQDFMAAFDLTVVPSVEEPLGSGRIGVDGGGYAGGGIGYRWTARDCSSGRERITCASKKSEGACGSHYQDGGDLGIGASAIGRKGEADGSRGI